MYQLLELDLWGPVRFGSKIILALELFSYMEINGT